MDISFKPDSSLKGSYYRRIEDIQRALEKLHINSLSIEMQFLTYYFGCEKLARGVTGIHKKQPAIKAYDWGQKFTLHHIIEAADGLKLSIQKNI